MAPANQVLAGGKQTCVSKPRQAGSVQVRQGSMSRYGASKVDMLSQTASAVVSNVQHATSASTVRECRTPIMPNWPRAASPERCMASRCTLQPQAIQLVPGSTQLPPPRLAASRHQHQPISIISSSMSGHTKLVVPPCTVHAMTGDEPLFQVVGTTHALLHDCLVRMIFTTTNGTDGHCA